MGKTSGMSFTSLSVYWHLIYRKTERNTRKELSGFPLATETKLGTMNSTGG